jgi:hypothetical protein
MASSTDTDPTMRTLACAAILATALPGQPREIWVDATLGNDADAGTADKPLRSMTRAATLAIAGDTISIRTGTYGGSATGELFPIRLTAPALRIRAVGRVIVDLEAQAVAAFVLRAGASGGRITGLWFFNADRTQWWAQTIETQGALTDYEIDRCVFDGVNRGVVLWESAPNLDRVRVHHNLFVNLGNDAINAFEKEGSYEVANNTIIGRTAGPNYVGILVESPNARIVNNLIAGMRDGFATGPGTLPASFVANDTWQNQQGWVGKITTPPPGNFAIDPQFLVGAGDDYRLSFQSPLIDAGAAVAAAKDRLGYPAPIDSDRNGSILPEVGAFEAPHVHMTAVWSAGTSTAIVAVTGLNGMPGTILFALDDGAFQLPGLPTILLDPSTLLAVTTAPAPLPINISAPVTPPPPGFRLVMQAIVADASSGTLQPSNQTWLQW